MIPPDLIERAKVRDILEVAITLGARLKRQGGEWIGPCVRCGGDDRFGVNIRKQIWNCRHCGKGGDVIGLVQHLTGATFAEAVAQIDSEAAPATVIKAPCQRKRPSAPLPSLWPAIWRESRDPLTPVERYLGSRGLELPALAASESLRFHRDCPFGHARTPAMVALVRDIRSNEPIGIHRTALTPDGRKAVIGGKARMALGTITGGVVKLDPDEEVELGLGIAEGLETTLALRQRWGAPVWACLWDGGVAAFPVLAGIEALTIACDHDQNQAGQRAAAEVGQRWREAGREVAVFFPNQPGDDLNDTGEADER